MALSIFGNGGCGTGTSCYIQLLKDFNRSQMFPKNLRLTSSPFPANKGGLYDDLKVCHQKVVVGIDSVPGSFQLLMVCWDAQGAPFSVATFLSFVFLHGWELQSVQLNPLAWREQSSQLTCLAQPTLHRSNPFLKTQLVQNKYTHIDYAKNILFHVVPNQPQ